MFDDCYVRTKEYSDLLVAKIPKRQRANIAISVILNRQNGDVYNLEYFMASLFDKLDEGEIARVYNVISKELEFTTYDVDIRTILHIIPAQYWTKVDKDIKLRIENILLENVKEGKYDETEGIVIDGALGTWIKQEHLLYFENAYTWTREIIEMLKKGGAEKAYVDKYFWVKICYANRNKTNFLLETYIKNGLKNKNEDIINKLKDEICFDKEHPWWKVFEDQLKEYPDIEYIDFSF